MSISIHVKSGQNNWQVSIDPASTILQLKEEIAKVSEVPATNQRLIFSGKILKDDQTVEFYKILDGLSIHMVKSGGGSANKNKSPPPQANTTATPVAPNMAAGETGGFNPLSDLTSARYAGYLNLPSADTFGPDGGLNNSGPNQDEMLRMLDNPVFQSQMNEMLSNPQMLDFIIQANPQLQAMGPQARQILQNPMFRQMLTNPDMIRQSMQMARAMNGGVDPNGNGQANTSSDFPAPGGDDDNTVSENTPSTTNTASTNPSSTATTNAANPFASLFNPAMNPFAAGMANTNAAGSGNPPAFDPSFFASMFQPPAAQQQQEDTRPPEERYEHQLRQLNDMGFFDFDRNVAALRRSGGNVESALNALLNGDV
ncbi:hypothetical protein NCAS_0C00430 [Naumovozyma castellii]|uniref:Ubiquitin domain-containing protein DSK2 n=1 Tax=Naumovozyma castellii TaxID=27288 RepID=G0VC26_NAUCA|nr:hypothetical protein NCAS_0C00430 [Naumovozyma castellii CBS 4309]CCC69033.1 hypothetical protein NCAS_0C00430 [Naumovozyma castellii CBS 4309]